MPAPAKSEYKQPGGLERPEVPGHALTADGDEEELAFVREMMKESRRTTRREIERLYGPIEMSE
jgi:hypothetical protein